MSTASVTSKGQVTIPARIRDLLEIQPGDRLFFESRGQEVRIRVVPRRQVADFLGAFETGEPFPGKEVERQQTGATRPAGHESGLGRCQHPAAAVHR